MKPIRKTVNRDHNLYETDSAAVKAMLQAAVNVELFTIPLYMATLYSIQGTHQITGKNDLYAGRVWPGAAPVFRKKEADLSPNQKAYNTIFSVFIEEMLHLQMASNLASIMGVVPKFTGLSPKEGFRSGNYGWECYGLDKDGNEITTIPHIVDLKDCEDPIGNINPGYIDYKNVKVKLDELNHTQNDLFLAIEAPEEQAQARVTRNRDKYFPKAPFEDWQAGDELPMFGSIGWMYQCLWDYVEISYDDGSKLWDRMYTAGNLQRDLFNTYSPGHPYREYQDFETTISGWLPAKAKDLAYQLICAITDQGEGNDVKKSDPNLLMKVKEKNQASDVAMQADYPSFNDKGEQLPPAESTHAAARSQNGGKDHYERFLEIRADMQNILTWRQWHEQVLPPGEERWKAEYLLTPDYKPDPAAVIPTPEEVAKALNSLNNPLIPGTGEPDIKKREQLYEQFCQIATGAIAGITTVLDQHWEDPDVGFPFPSMGGSGDRLMMCWAVFGQLPDLAVGVTPRDDSPEKLYHACQGLDLSRNPDSPNNCASPEIFHNCRGSNSCKAEGGCGFAQKVGQSKGCGSSVRSLKVIENMCPAKPDKDVYSAPGDNVCGSFGGCAVPISASQIFPLLTPTSTPADSYPMEINDFKGPKYTPEKLKFRGADLKIRFKKGDAVYDKAWEAYSVVMRSRNPEWSGEKPQASDIRVAFPPST